MGAPAALTVSAGVTLPAGVEPGRLAAAAATLTAEPIGPGQYAVTDGAALPKCDCGDALWRPAFVCKHILASRLAAGDASVIAALAALLVADAPPHFNGAPLD